MTAGMSTRQPGRDSPRDCDPKACDDAGEHAGGPVREAGGTTGEGNLSPQQASRTGGATSGVGSEQQKPARSGTLPPDA